MFQDGSFAIVSGALDFGEVTCFEKGLDVLHEATLAVGVQALLEDLKVFLGDLFVTNRADAKLVWGHSRTNVGCLKQLLSHEIFIGLQKEVSKFFIKVAGVIDKHLVLQVGEPIEKDLSTALVTKSLVKLGGDHPAGGLVDALDLYQRRLVRRVL